MLKLILTCTVLAVLLGTGSPLAVAGIPSTAFNYQGYLESGGSPADGVFDFKFRLYDASENGNQEGSEVIAPNVTVTEGVFAVLLDFGAAALDGVGAPSGAAE